MLDEVAELEIDAGGFVVTRDPEVRAESIDRFAEAVGEAHLAGGAGVDVDAVEDRDQHVDRPDHSLVLGADAEVDAVEGLRAAR